MAAPFGSGQIYCYILKKTSQGEKDVSAGLNSNDNGYHKILSLMGIERTNVQVARGEFVQPLPTVNAPHLQTHKYRLSRDPTITFLCSPSDVGALTHEEYDYLAKLEAAPERRYNLYIYKQEQAKERPTRSESGEKAKEPPATRPRTQAAPPPKIGSTVLVPSYGPRGFSYYGVVRWLGLMAGGDVLMAGIELEEDVKGCTDGVSKQGDRYFHCPPNRGLFYSFESLQPDDRERSSDLLDDEQFESPTTYSPTRTHSYQVQQEDSLDKEKEKARQKQLQKEASAQAEDSLAKEKEKARQKQLHDKETALKEEELSKEKSAKQVEYEKRKKEEELAEAKGKKLLEDDGDPQQDVASLHQKIIQLTVQLEQERRKRQELEIELAFERKKMLEMRKETNMTNSPETIQGPRLAALRGSSELNLSWKINRQDVMRIRTLGGGAWGLVYEGWYKGHAVAIKEPHLAIMSENTNKRIEREINIMALVQHPNLVRFIGAVMDDDARSLKLPPLLVTELLDIDLRSAYKKHNLSQSQLPIFRDVAYALHYLHEHQEPIIHRDVSAPNVLLEALPNDLWRAKVSDFGSANIAKFSKTAAEGAIIYSAPETFPSSDLRKPLAKQTTKIDTFSFGILVSEVITCKQPNPETRNEIIEEVRGKWKVMYDLVLACVRQKPEERLTMADILKVLNSIPNPRRQHV